MTIPAASTPSLAEGLKELFKRKTSSLQGFPTNGDVTDWLQTGGSKAKLLQLVEECTGCAPEDPENIDEKLSVLLEKAQNGNTEAPFDAAPLLATLPKHEDMKWRQRFQALSGGMNLNHLSEAVSEIRKEQKRAEKRKVLPTPSGLPTIIVNSGQLPELTDKALSALQRLNSATPSVFSRAGLLVRIRCDERNRPTIESISESALRGYLARSAVYIIETEMGTIDAKPPSDVVRDILSLAEWPHFSTLTAIIETPTLRENGTILSKSGYDAQTGLFYIPSGDFRLRRLPASPTKKDAQRAARLIQDEVLSDFPFKDQASIANAFAMILTALLRQTLIPKSPLALIDALKLEPEKVYSLKRATKSQPAGRQP